MSASDGVSHLSSHGAASFGSFGKDPDTVFWQGSNQQTWKAHMGLISWSEVVLSAGLSFQSPPPPSEHSDYSVAHPQLYWIEKESWQCVFNRPWAGSKLRWNKCPHDLRENHSCPELLSCVNWHQNVLHQTVQCCMTTEINFLRNNYSFFKWAFTTC